MILGESVELLVPSSFQTVLGDASECSHLVPNMYYRLQQYATLNNHYFRKQIPHSGSLHG